MICPKCRYELDDDHDRYCDLVQEIVRITNRKIMREIRKA